MRDRGVEGVTLATFWEELCRFRTGVSGGGRGGRGQSLALAAFYVRLVFPGHRWEQWDGIRERLG